MTLEPNHTHQTETTTMADAKLTPEVTDVLTRSTITETLLTLPEGQLESKLYTKVAGAIKLAGGVWKTNKKGFVFASDPRACLGLALKTGVIVDKKKLTQSFYTPDELAAEVAMLAGVTGLQVLEPSAGSGALVRACLKWSAAGVDAIELQDTCRDALQTSGCNTFMIADFLTVAPYRLFPRVVMNPPFQKSQDLKHIKHALTWLTPGGTLHAIVPDKDCPKLAALGAATVKRFPAGAFKQSGTMVATRLIRIAAL